MNKIVKILLSIIMTVFLLNTIIIFFVNQEIGLIIMISCFVLMMTVLFLYIIWSIE